jgi:hypothetical protein
VAAGTFFKPSLVGAKTVNGPALERLSTSLPAATAVTREERSGKDWASSAMCCLASEAAVTRFPSTADR